MSYEAFEQKLIDKIKTADKKMLYAFIASFLLINLAFLFHSTNFMFGDHDWNYVRGAVKWNEGSFEGRPLHFLLQSVLFDGNVFPILNNLFSFAALSLSGILLAKYWKIPATIVNYTIFSTFIAVLPYTLVWLYYAKDTLINLSLPLICMVGILCAERGRWGHLAAILILFCALSSYITVIEYIGIVVLGRMIIELTLGKKELITVVKQKLPLFGDIAIAGILYLLILKTANLTSDYNTKTIDMAYLPEKIGATLNAMLTQFTVQLPFMETKYKMLIFGFTLIGVGSLVFRGKYILINVLIAFAMLFCSKFAYFIADERGQILAEMENFAYVPRLDFYGIVYLYAFGIGGLLQFSRKTAKKIVITICSVLIFMSVVRDMYAQKVWKFGFEAEMKAHERIVSRLESMSEFNTDRRYRLFQVGSLSLRKNFYISQNAEETSLDLLSTSYTPEFMSHIVYNFYYPQDIFYQNAFAEDVSARGRDFILHHAEVWPQRNSIYIDGDVVIIILSEEKLHKLRKRYK